MCHWNPSELSRKAPLSTGLSLEVLSHEAQLHHFGPAHLEASCRAGPNQDLNLDQVSFQIPWGFQKSPKKTEELSRRESCRPHFQAFSFAPDLIHQHINFENFTASNPLHGLNSEPCSCRNCSTPLNPSRFLHTSGSSCRSSKRLSHSGLFFWQQWSAFQHLVATRGL